MTAPSYKTNDPKGWCGDPKRGAPLGRTSLHAGVGFTGKLYVQRIPLDGDYDNNGTYWGAGEPLYWYADEDYEVDATLRATSIEAACCMVSQRYPRASVEVVHEIDLDAFVAQYVETALWSSNSDDDRPLDARYCEDDLAPETLASMRADCEKFIAANAEDLKAHEDPTMGAHDFWLTRNRHGAGFWDGDWPDPQAIRLTQNAQAFGEVNLYVGDDGKIYIA